MQIKQAMTRGVEVVRPDDTLQEAARKMKSLDVGALPVCDGDRLVGMITDRDIIVRATAEGRDPRTTMTAEVVYVYEDEEGTAAPPTGCAGPQQASGGDPVPGRRRRGD
jgi:CBS domain-containing protein